MSEVNRVVVRAERGCHTCRYRIYDTLEEPCASCNFSLADKWQPRGERSEAIAQRSGPDNARREFPAASAGKLDGVVGHSESGGGRE